MKIYSWNMLYRNLEQDRAFAYISGLEFDVLCLQEVPEEFLSRLRTLPYHLASTIDCVLTRGARTLNLYHIILTPHSIHAVDSFPMPPLTLSFRSVLLLILKERWTGLAGRRGLYADITFPEGRTRVFSLHLAVTSLAHRKHDFSEIEKHLSKELPAILAGDFNIIDHPLVKPFCWFFGASVMECMPWHSEREEMEGLFKKWELKNPLRGKVTLNVCLSQLDHVLVPETVAVLRAEVRTDRYGSDHNPVHVEIE